MDAPPRDRRERLLQAQRRRKTWTEKSKTLSKILSQVVPRGERGAITVLAKAEMRNCADHRVTVVAIVVHEGVAYASGKGFVDEHFRTLAAFLAHSSSEPDRRSNAHGKRPRLSKGSGSEDEVVCGCQGSPYSGGASYTFGCTYSSWINGCKFANSPDPEKVPKFKLRPPQFGVHDVRIRPLKPLRVFLKWPLLTPVV